MTARNVVHVDADLLERMAFDGGGEIIAGPDSMSLRVGTKTFVAPIALPRVPDQREPGAGS